MHKEPYTFDGKMISVSFPVTEGNFVNRQEILRRFFLAYQRRQNVALVGHRRIGKTSIAKEFLRQISNEKAIKLIFDVHENLGTPARFVITLIKSFLTPFLRATPTTKTMPLVESTEQKSYTLC